MKTTAGGLNIEKNNKEMVKLMNFHEVECNISF